jgi:hypothetical protein
MTEMNEFVTRIDLDPASVPGLVREAGGWRYANHRTGVTAYVDGIGTLHTPLPRPSFTGLELAAAFGLDATRLGAFADANREATGQHAGDPELAVLAPDDGEAWWHYQGATSALRLTWPSMDVTIADLVLWREREGRRARRVMVWPDDVSVLVIPRAADVLVLRPAAVFGRAATGSPGLVPVAELLARFPEHCRAFDDPVAHLVYRGGLEHGAIRRALEAVATPARALRPAALDRIIDGPSPGGMALPV